MARQDSYAQVQNAMVLAIEKAIEDGTKLPWHKPWGDELAPKNLKSKKPYRGSNVWILSAANYDCPYWATFDQVKQMGGRVKPRPEGAKIWGWPIVFFKPLIINEERNGVKQKKVIPMWKSYTVFNAKHQCDGLEDKIPEPVDKADFAPIELAEKMDENMKDKPEIFHDSAHAFYRPSTDEIHLPETDSFDNAEAYYCTKFHELIHSTGHAKRIGRKEITDTSMFGDHAYSKEELVAEMGAAFLCGAAGIEGTFDNSVAYMRGWLKKIKDDVKLIISAGAAAQKAADYVRGVEFGPFDKEQDVQKKEMEVELSNWKR